MDNFITVITTVKNGEQYLSETLESIRAQTYKNFEHIIVDDGSSDNTLIILNNFKKQHKHYPLFIYSVDYLGRGKALNYAISKAKGSWIAIIDADDIWHPRKLEIQVKYITKCSIDVLATQTLLFNDLNQLSFGQCDNLVQPVYYSIIDFLKNNHISHSSVLIKKSLCFYDENRNSQFDFELWLRLAAQNKAIARISCTLNFHRIHENQSFEGRSIIRYRFRHFELVSTYCFLYNRYDLLIYDFIKCIVLSILPRIVLRKELRK